jgi:hypothetical protein
VVDYYKSSLVNNFLFENYCKAGERWGSKHEELLEKILTMRGFK